jgi:hypothetical protein
MKYLKVTFKVINGEIILRKKELSLEKETPTKLILSNEEEIYSVKKTDINLLKESMFRDDSNFYQRVSFMEVDEENKIYEKYQLDAKKHFQKIIDKATLNLNAFIVLEK